MSYHGDIRLGSTINIKCTTVSSTGAPTTLAGTPVVSAYPDNSLTQLTAGITLSVDFDGVTGLNNVAVVASGGNGYAAGVDYSLVITTGTVGGASVVGYIVGSFSIAHRTNLTAAEVNTQADQALADYDAPTKAELDAGFAALNDVDTTEVQTAAAAALTAYDPPTKAELDAGLAALNDLSAAEVKTQVDASFTTQMADSVPADGTIATREQALYMVLQMLTEFAISGTTLTVKKPDGATTLITLTLDDDTNPTSITRAT